MPFGADPNFFDTLARERALRGRWDVASPIARMAIARPGLGPATWGHPAVIFPEAGDREGHRRLCRTIAADDHLKKVWSVAEYAA